MSHHRWHRGTLLDRRARTDPLPSEASRRDFDEWARCTTSAVDALASQSEPAQTVVDAALAACWHEQSAYQKSADFSDRLIENVKIRVLVPQMLAQVMAVRAAGAKLRKENPKAKPAIDYGRM